MSHDIEIWSPSDHQTCMVTFRATIALEANSMKEARQQIKMLLMEDNIEQLQIEYFSIRPFVYPIDHTTVDASVKAWFLTSVTMLLIAICGVITLLLTIKYGR